MRGIHANKVGTKMHKCLVGETGGIWMWPEEQGSSVMGVEWGTGGSPGNLYAGDMNGSRQSPRSPRDRHT